LIENLDLNVSKSSTSNEFPTSFSISIDNKKFDFILIKSYNQDNIFKIDSAKNIRKIENFPDIIHAAYKQVNGQSIATLIKSNFSNFRIVNIFLVFKPRK